MEEPLYTLKGWADHVSYSPADADYIMACIKRNNWERYAGFEATEDYWQHAANSSGLHPNGKYFRFPLTKHL